MSTLSVDECRTCPMTDGVCDVDCRSCLSCVSKHERAGIVWRQRQLLIEQGRAELRELLRQEEE